MDYVYETNVNWTLSFADKYEIGFWPQLAKKTEGKQKNSRNSKHFQTLWIESIALVSRNQSQHFFLLFNSL